MSACAETKANQKHRRQNFEINYAFLPNSYFIGQFFQIQAIIPKDFFSPRQNNRFNQKWVSTPRLRFKEICRYPRLVF